MKKIMVVALLLSQISMLTAQKQSPYQAEVEAMLQKMTTEEKVGQMTQVTMALITHDGWADQDGTIDKAKLRKAVVDYKVGSILNTTAHALSLDTWHDVLTQIMDMGKENRLNIPVIYGLDAIHGQTYTLNSTLFPHNIALAASRNLDLGRQISKVTANELRATGVRWNFDPVLDIGRQPLWSRFPETYGEDVHLLTKMGVGAIEAYEEDGLKNPTAVASCMKHYIGYSASRTGKDRTPMYIPENELREYYLPQFQAAINAGSSTIMINSGEINGEPVHASKYLLTEVLRKEMGFQGLVVTDWEDIIRLHTRHNIAATPREAVVMAINAGIDMSMVPGDYSFYDLLMEAIAKKEVPMSRIDDAVQRILTLKYKVGLMDNPYPEAAAKENFGKAAYQDLALSSAQECMTLLKNRKNILPLSKNQNVLVAGPSAQSISALNGCWSYTWQGREEEWYPKDHKTIYQAIQDEIGAENVFTTTAKGFSHYKNYDTKTLEVAARAADVVVLCLGEDAYAESPGNIADLDLPAEQKALVHAASAMGTPVVLVLTEGRPRFITDVEPMADGILLAYWSGRKTGEAVADVLFGDYNPSGILPFTYHKNMGDMVLYDRKPTEEIREVFNDNIGNGYDPLYPFGHGLSYTTFEYSDLKLSTTKLKGDASLTVSVRVTNTGTRSGKHCVELYSRDLYASLTPCMKRLRAFQKIELAPKASEVVRFQVNRKDLAFVNIDLETVTEEGVFEVMIGAQKATFEYVK